MIITLLIPPLHTHEYGVAGFDGDGTLVIAQVGDRHDTFGLLTDIEEHVFVVYGDNGGFAALLAGGFV